MDGRQLGRVRPRDAVPGDRPAARAEGGLRHGRHDAARRRPGEAARGHAGREIFGEAVIYKRHRHRYEVNNQLRRRLEDEGLVCGGTSPDERLVEMVELPDHPFFVASQFHPEFKSRPNRPEPLFRDFVGAALARRARAPSRRRAASATAESGDDVGVTSPRRLRRDRSRARALSTTGACSSASSALCEIASPTGPRARGAPTRCAAELRGLGVEVAEDDAAAAAGAGAGNLLARIPGRGRGVGAVLRPPRHRPARRARSRSVCEDGVFRSRRRDDPRRRQQGGGRGAARAAARARPPSRRRSGSSCSSPSPRRTGCAGAKAFDVAGLRAAFGYVLDHASPIGEVIVAAPTYKRIVAELQGLEAHAGIRPEDGHSAIAAAARAIARDAARAPRRGDDRERRRDRRAAPPSTSSPAHVPGRGARRAASTRRRRGARSRELVDALRLGARASTAATSTSRSSEIFRGYRDARRAGGASLAEAGAARAAATSPTRVATGGGSDANALGPPASMRAARQRHRRATTPPRSASRPRRWRGCSTSCVRASARRGGSRC